MDRMIAEFLMEMLLGDSSDVRKMKPNFKGIKQFKSSCKVVGEAEFGDDWDRNSLVEIAPIIYDESKKDPTAVRTNVLEGEDAEKRKERRKK